MRKSEIHPTAIVEPGAELGQGVVVEAYAVVKGTVSLRNDVTIKSHAYIDGNTVIDEGTTVWPFASIGTKTQDLKYRGERTYVYIGKNCEIREYATINSSSGPDTEVRVGDSCLIMAYCHIAHNCTVGNHVIMSNNATLAGHVTIDDYAIIGGMTPIHQFSRIGRYAMVGGMSRISHDVPPYLIGTGCAPFRFGGVNRIGLKRHGFSLKTRQLLSQAFKLIYRSGLHLDEALVQIEKTVEQIPEVKHFLEFCRTSERGLLGIQGVASQNSVEPIEYLEDYAEATAEG